MMSTAEWSGPIFTAVRSPLRRLRSGSRVPRKPVATAVSSLGASGTSRHSALKKRPSLVTAPGGHKEVVEFHEAVLLSPDWLWPGGRVPFPGSAHDPGQSGSVAGYHPSAPVHAAMMSAANLTPRPEPLDYPHG